MGKIIVEWCAHCESETMIHSKNEYQNCKSCNELIAPCSAYDHTQKAANKCICMK